MLVDIDILSSLLGKCLLTAKVCIALYIYVTFCTMYLFPHFFTAENENFDEVFSEVITCKRIRGGFFCKVNSFYRKYKM